MCAECHFVHCSSGCPNYVPPPHDLRCSFCDEGMYYEDAYVIKGCENFCTDCIENLSDDQLSHLLRVVWIAATSGARICHLCEENIEKDEVYTFLNGKPHHKDCLADLELESLMELADVDSDPYRK